MLEEQILYRNVMHGELPGTPRHCVVPSDYSIVTRMNPVAPRAESQ